MLERIVTKITSGQWILTVACAFVFSWCSVNKQLDTGDIKAIILVVMYAYFTRDRSVSTQQSTSTNNAQQ